jgi:hypothetical protein
LGRTRSSARCGTVFPSSIVIHKNFSFQFSTFRFPLLAFPPPISGHSCRINISPTAPCKTKSPHDSGIFRGRPRGISPSEAHWVERGVPLVAGPSFRSPSSSIKISAFNFQLSAFPRPISGHSCRINIWSPALCKTKSHPDSGNSVFVAAARWCRDRAKPSNTDAPVAPSHRSHRRTAVPTHRRTGRTCPADIPRQSRIFQIFHSCIQLQFSEIHNRFPMRFR